MEPRMNCAECGTFLPDDQDDLCDFCDAKLDDEQFAEANMNDWARQYDDLNGAPEGPDDV